MRKLTYVILAALIFTSPIHTDAKKAYTKTDVKYLAKTINAEAGNVSKRCQELVGVVVVNRRNHKLFPNTIKDVVLAPGQYACVGTTKWKEKPPKSIIKLSKKLLKKNYVKRYPSTLVYQANFIQGTSVYETVDTVYFCCM